MNWNSDIICALNIGNVILLGGTHFTGSVDKWVIELDFWVIGLLKNQSSLSIL